MVSNQSSSVYTGIGQVRRSRATENFPPYFSFIFARYIDDMTLAKTLLSLSALLLINSSALANVYKCVDSNGRVTYTNDAKLNKGCTRLSEDLPVSSIPPPDYVSPSSQPTASGTPAATGSFPKVSPTDQQQRDGTRRQILEKELAQEQMALDQAKAALAEQEAVRYGNERNYQKVLDRLKPFQEKIEIHSRNIDALQREIGSLK